MRKEHTMNIDDIDLSDLEEDGDTLELPDGRMLRLVIEQDWEASINDFDFYGRVSKTHAYRYAAIEPRPKDFTGNAEKLSCGGAEWVWWEPPADVVRGTPEFAWLRQSVIDLLVRGFYCVGLDLCDGTDAYGRPIVVDRASLAGCDSSDPDEYLSDLLVGLLGGES
jgi:hypothetical protein